MVLRKLVFILLFILILVAVGCEDEERMPPNTSPRMYGLGIAALEIVDDFLDGKINADTAHQLFKAKNSEINEQYKQATLTSESDTLIGTDKQNDARISSKTGQIDYLLFDRSMFRPSLYENASEDDPPPPLMATDEKITESRNELAALLWEKPR